MKFKSVEVFSSADHATAPLVFYRDPDVLYIWFDPDSPSVWILTLTGWALWSPGMSIAQVLRDE